MSARARLARESGSEARRRPPSRVGRRLLARCRPSGRWRVGPRWSARRSSGRPDGPSHADRPQGWPARPAAHGRCVGAERSLMLIGGLSSDLSPTSPHGWPARMRPAREEDLEGEQSPWKDGTSRGRQRSRGVRTRRRSNASESTWRSRERSARTAGGQRPRRRGTAAGGDSFGGCEVRCEDGVGPPARSGSPGRGRGIRLPETQRTP